MGKTALATNIAFNAAKAYREEVGDGRIEGQGGRQGGVLLAGNVGRAARHPHPGRAHGHLRRPHPPRRGARGGFRQVRPGGAGAAAPALLHRRHAGLTVPALRTRARRLKRQHGLGLIVVDYLQLIRPTAGGRSDNRVQEVSEITRGLKTVAKELDVPVIALSQLSPRRRAARGQAAAARRPARSPARSSRMPTW